MKILRRLDRKLSRRAFDRRWLWISVVGALIFGGATSEGILRGQPVIGTLIGALAALAFIVLMTALILAEAEPDHPGGGPTPRS